MFFPLKWAKNCENEVICKNAYESPLLYELRLLLRVALLTGLEGDRK